MTIEVSFFQKLKSTVNYIHQYWFGKLVCIVVFGYLWGVVGVLIGALVGHAWDFYRRLTSFAKGFNKFYQNKPGERGIGVLQGGFLQSLFMVLGRLAKSDGRVSEAEIRWAEGLMQRLYLKPEQKREAIEWFNKGKQEEIGLEEKLTEFSQYVSPAGLGNLFMGLLVECARCDGEITVEEKALLKVCAVHLNIPDWRLSALLKQQFYGRDSYQQKGYQSQHRYYQNNGDSRYSGQHSSSRSSSSVRQLSWAYSLIGVNPSSTKADVKKSYRKLMSQHHPDKLESQGVPPEMLNLAKEKTQEIQVAYEMICKARGF